MKNCPALYRFLTYALVLSGCAAKPDISSSIDEQMKGLFLVESEQICQEVQSNKMWQRSKEGPFYSLEEAYQYADELELGGYKDWRLPTKSELFNLYYIHYWKNDKNCVMNQKGDFWAVSKGQVPSMGHWEDYFLCGPEYKFVESFKNYGYVRSIRP